jgi:tetratricopeptide (TPR) repeat protein
MASTAARAQGTPAEQRAHEWLNAGEAAFAQGRFGDALDAFEMSYRKQSAPHTLRRIGDAADKLGSPARAEEAFSAYLKHVPDASDREYIRGRIDANHAALGAVHPKALAVQAAPMTPASASDHRPGHVHPVQTSTELAAPTLAVSNTRSETTHRDPAGPFWVWAAGGAVVVTGIVIAALVISAGGSASSPEPVRGNVGSAIQTLGSR